MVWAEEIMRFKNSKTTSRLTPIKRSDFGAIENIVDSESESVSSSTQFKQEFKPNDKKNKIIISPLERTSTVKSNELIRINSIVSKVAPLSTPAQEHNKSRNNNVMNYNTTIKRRPTVSKFKINHEVVDSPDHLQLKGEKVSHYKNIQKNSRYMTSREKGIISTLVSDGFSRKTSNEELNKNTMAAVYDKVIMTNH